MKSYVGREEVDIEATLRVTRLRNSYGYRKIARVHVMTLTSSSCGG
jgi:hypothetical protein